MATKQQQVEEFKKNKATYDNASTAEEKKAVITNLNQPKSTSTASTTNTANTASTLKGVDDATANKAYNSTFTTSADQQTAQNKANSGANRVENLTNNKSLVSGETYALLNGTFEKPTAVVEADAYIKTQLNKIQSGKTSYSDQVKDMIAQIQGRDKFSYDVDNDPLFQQALASAMSSGKQAMQDTIGQASALTGGYGSTYATTAGNQAYNGFIEDAYDNLSQYYQMALEAYQMEGDEMYRQLGMLNEADATEYNRNITAYDATYQHRNQMYNEAYQIFRDNKADLLNSANLKLTEHGQLVSDAMNYYNVASDNANTLYNREYQSWADEVNQAQQYAQMLNNEYWKQTTYDRDVYESDRAYDRGVFESDRSYDQTEKWNQADEDYRRDALAQDESQFSRTLDQKQSGKVVNGVRSDYTFSPSEQNAIREAYNSAGGGTAGEEAVSALLDRMGLAPQTEEEIALVQSLFGEEDNKITYNGKKYTTTELEAELQKQGLNSTIILKLLETLPKGKSVTFGKHTYTK